MLYNETATLFLYGELIWCYFWCAQDTENMYWKGSSQKKLARSTEAFYKRFKTLTNCASSIQPLISQSSVCICNIIKLIQIQSGNLEPNIFYFLRLIYNNKEHTGVHRNRKRATHAKLILLEKDSRWAGSTFQHCYRSLFLKYRFWQQCWTTLSVIKP